MKYAKNNALIWLIVNMIGKIVYNEYFDMTCHDTLMSFVSNFIDVLVTNIENKSNDVTCNELA